MNNDPFNNPRHLDENGKMIYELLPEEIRTFRAIMEAHQNDLCDECHAEAVAMVLRQVVNDEERSRGPRREDMQVCAECAQKLLETEEWEEA